MKILFLLFVIVAVISGFVGLIFTIKGFVDKDNKKIYLGTALMCFMLIIGIAGAFHIGKRAIDYKGYHCNQTQMIDESKKCWDNGLMGEILNCCQGEFTAKIDSNGVEIVMKVVLDKKQYQKKCMKKCEQKCGQYK